MSNGHNNNSHKYKNSTNIKIAFFLNLIFTIAEIIGGFWTNSIAILSDALHDLGDSLSLGLSWFLENYSHKEPDKHFTFGYSRFSLLGALVNSIILIVGSIFILSEAIPRLLNPESVKPKGMLLFSIGGIIINGLAAYRLKSGDSLNEKVVSWHLLEDVLGWIAIFIVSIILIFKKIPILDPILSISITIYILYNIIKKLKDILNIFLQGTPEEISINQIKQKIVNNTNVESIHHTHIWSLEGENNLLSTHVVVDENTTKEEIIDIKNNIKSLMKDEDIGHVTVEIDYNSEECTDNNDRWCK